MIQNTKRTRVQKGYNKKDRVKINKKKKQVPVMSNVLLSSSVLLPAVT